MTKFTFIRTIRIFVVFAAIFMTFETILAHEGDPGDLPPAPQGYSDSDILISNTDGGCSYEEVGNIIYLKKDAPSEPWQQAKQLYRLSEFIRALTTPKHIGDWLNWPIVVRWETPHDQNYGGWQWYGGWDAQQCILIGGFEIPDTFQHVRIITIVNMPEEDGTDFEIGVAAHELSHAWGAPHGAASPLRISADRQSTGVNDAYWWSHENGHRDSPAIRAWAGACNDMLPENDPLIVADPWCHMVYKAVVLGEIWIPEGEAGRLIQTIP